MKIICIILQIFWLVLVSLLPAPVASYCRPCSSRGKVSCISADGCFWSSSGRCSGFAQCDDDGGGGTVSPPDCSGNYCTGSPTIDPCANATDPPNPSDANNTFAIDLRDIQCSLFSFGCDWNNVTEVCEPSEYACSSLLYKVEEGECNLFGCEWTPETCEGQTSGTSVLRGHSYGCAYGFSLLSIVVATLFTASIFSW